MSPMAETTTTTSLPACLVAMMRRATLRILSASPTEVPPYFWTIRDMYQSVPGGLFFAPVNGDERSHPTHQEKADTGQNAGDAADSEVRRNFPEGRGPAGI